MFCACTETTAIVTAGMARTEADRRKDEFLAMLSHELRNPLAPISTASQLLMLSSDPALVHASAGIIARQVRHMTELVDDLLDVSRVTRGLVPPGDGSDPPRRGHRQRCRAGCARKSLRANHALRLRLPETPLHVRGDRTRLTQIFTNLLDNAAKYTPEGGELGISVEVSGPQVTIHVCDTGQGIEPTLLPHIFELFTQADRSPTAPKAASALDWRSFEAWSDFTAE
jgi:signal transduction histidine kinase